MLRVALTGGAASGKSAATAILRDMGALVSQSDEIGRAMMQPGHAVYDGIVAHFGPGVMRPDGLLDRQELARLAFSHGRVQELNAIVHPAVIAAQAAWLRQMAADHPRAVAVVESALVLETTFGEGGGKDGTAHLPWRSQFDRIVLVTAPEALRLQRYVQRVLSLGDATDRQTIEDEARRRFAVQMPEDRKRALADVTVENDGSLEQLRERLRDLYAQLHREAEDCAVSAM